MPDAGRPLADALGRRVPRRLVEALEPEEIGDLAARIEGVRKAQSRELRAAAGAALDHVPRLLRGTVKRIVFR